MLLALKNIENKFSEKLVMLAESILDESNISMPRSASKDLWVFEVKTKEDLTFEVEIQLKGKKVKAFTCDCENFSLEKKCEHLVAGLLQLRKYLTLKELKKRTELRPRTTAPKKLTTSSVLNNVSHDELKEFIRAYARQDSRFSLALKAKFANAVELEDSKEKYLQLLNSTLTSVKVNNGKINYQGALQIRKVVRDILDQVDDALALEHYREVISILQAIFEKISPIVRMTAPNERILVEVLKNTLLSKKELARKKLPPDLQKELWEFSVGLITKGTFRKYEIQEYLYDNISTLTISKKRSKEVLEKIDDLLPDLIDRQSRIPLLLLKMNLLEQFKPKALDNFIEIHLNEKEILLAAVEKTFKDGAFSKSKQLALKGLETQKSVEVKNQLEDYLLKIAQQTNSQKDIVHYGRLKFYKTYDFKYFLILKNELDKNWNLELTSLLEELESSPYHPKKKNIFAQIYAHENRPSDLFLYIKKIRSLELLQQYDEQLIAFSKQDTYILYEDLIITYLQSHIGRKASEKIRGILFHLKKIGATKLVYQMVKHFKTEYKERHTLMEELAYF